MFYPELKKQNIFDNKQGGVIFRTGISICNIPTLIFRFPYKGTEVFN